MVTACFSGERLRALLDGTLTPAERTVCLRHLDQCRMCQQRLREQQRLTSCQCHVVQAPPLPRSKPVAETRTAWADTQVLRQDHLPLAEVERFELLADGPTTDDAGVERAFAPLKLLEHEELRMRAERAMQARQARLQALVELERLSCLAAHQPTFEHDLLLKRHWHREAWLPDPRGEMYRGLAETATQRVRSVRRLNRLAKSPTMDGEQLIATCMQSLPPQYHPELERRTRLAHCRLERLRLLDEALREPVSDTRVAAISQSLARLKAFSLLSEELKQRVKLAGQRAELIRRLQAALDLPPHERDRQLLTGWNVELLNSCCDAETLAPFWHEARRRGELTIELIRACEDDNATAVRSIADSPLFAHWKWCSEAAAALEQFGERRHAAQRGARQALEQALLDRDADRFCECFDAELVGALATELPHHRRTIDRFIEREILPRSTCSASSDLGDGLSHVGRGQWRARWIWPDARFVQSCRIVVTNSKPTPHAIPEDLPRLYDMELQRPPHVGPPQFIEFNAPPAWSGAGVFVWGVIHLGTERIYSEPLALGRFVSSN